MATNEKNTVMETNEKVNEILNDLIRINHDRAERYEKIIGQLPDSDTDLKYLFKQFIFDSEQNADKLSYFVLKMAASHQLWIPSQVKFIVCGCG